jgi:Fibronectin type III domain/IPT/TIG domain
MAFDPSMGVSGELLLFGGISGSSYLGDTWAWNGTTWTEVATTGPTVRANASLAYDSATSQMVLFGGEDSSGSLGDTWTWNGSSWSERSPTTNPGSLASASLAYDPSWSQLILFGGYDGTSDEANTWEWTGANWEELSPISSPPATDGSPMAYDPDVSSAVLFEASSASTWTWNGTDWAQVTPETSPSARTETAMAYDGGTAQIVLFGGDVGGGGNTDTWVLNPPSVTGISPSAGPVSNDAPIEITGTGFTGATAVDFGSSPATSYTILSGTEITATPPGGSGAVDVTVTNPDGSSSTSSDDQYSYDPMPAVTAVEPDAGVPGGHNSVEIEGTSLTGATSVSFGANSTTNITVDNSSVLTVNSVPAGVLGSTVDVTVTTPGGTSLIDPSEDGYTYEETPIVGSIAPDSGPVGGGTLVTITGSDFTDSTEVDFGPGNPGTSLDVRNSTTLTILDPSGPARDVDVTVTTPLGRSDVNSLQGVFTYIGDAPSSPTALTITTAGCSVLLSWSPPKNLGGSPITGYKIFVGTTPANALSGPAAATTDETTYHLYGLDCGTKYYFVVRAENEAGTGPPSNEASVILSAASSPCAGRYWEDASDGGVFSFGHARFYGSMGGRTLNKPMVGMAATPDCKGYWLVASDGGVFSFGDAIFYGSMGAHHLNKPIVGMESTPDGKGYWLVASDGGIFSFGDATFFGSTGSLRLNAPVVGMADLPNGGGYWLVASDGGVFSFGAARFHGSMGSHRLNDKVVGIASTEAGLGYWFISADGGVFSFGDAHYHGSTANIALRSDVTGVAATVDGDGYWLVATDGGIFSFGDADFFGSMGERHLNEPIVGMTT